VAQHVGFVGSIVFLNKNVIIDPFDKDRLAVNVVEESHAVLSYPLSKKKVVVDRVGKNTKQ